MCCIDGQENKYSVITITILDIGGGDYFTTDGRSVSQSVSQSLSMPPLWDL
jgi:hypothetical protein